MALTSESIQSLLSLMMSLSLSPKGVFCCAEASVATLSISPLSPGLLGFVESLGCSKHLLFEDDRGQISFPSRSQGRIHADISTSLSDLTRYASADRHCLTKSHPVSWINPSRCRNISNMTETPTADRAEVNFKEKERESKLSVFKISLMDQLVLCMIWKQ